MWEKLTVLGFGLLMVLGPLALAAWLLLSGQAAGVEAIFLVLTCLIFAGVGLLSARFLVKPGGKVRSGSASSAGA